MALEDLVLQVGGIGKWIQAVGLLVISWFIIQIINLYFNRRRRKLIERTYKKVNEIDRKLDKLLKKKK